MMTSWHWNIFGVAGPLRGETTVHRWFSSLRASYAQDWYFPWGTPEQTFERTVDIPLIWDAMKFMWRHCNIWHGTDIGNFTPLSIYENQGLPSFIASKCMVREIQLKGKTINKIAVDVKTVCKVYPPSAHIYGRFQSRTNSECRE